MSMQDEMTMERAEQEMECLREVFSVVRLLSEDVVRRLPEEDPAVLPNGCPCYAFWNKSTACENCISRKALEEKSQESKIEFMNDEGYYVISRYLEVDGKPYVMEMLRKLDPDTMVDQEGFEKLVKQITGYNEKLYLDALTGVYNRRFYEEKVREMKGMAGVAVLDLDDFKLYNDTFGHGAGDMALERTVDVIRKNVRKTDMLIRYGGDEFLLVMPDVPPQIFVDKLETIRKKVHEEAVPGYSRLQMSVSIGGVMFRDGTIEMAIDWADRLMYRAKAKKNLVVTEWDEETQQSLPDDSAENRSGTKQLVLIVDDSPLNRELLKSILERDYSILEAADGNECIRLMEQYGTGISCVLLDIVMPETDGFEVLAMMNQRNWVEDIPVIMISSEDSENYIRKAYELGVSDYISRPFDEKVVYRRVFNMIKLYAKQRRLVHLVTDQIYEKEKNNRMLIAVLSHVVEFRNGESGLHVIHINRLTEILLGYLIKKTERYHLSWDDQYLITTASALHDIGKIGIDERILNKPGKLTEEEFEVMKTHTMIGANILSNLGMYQDEKLIKVARDICRWHHERWDGRGYPDGLRGDDIPISAQVVALADVYDALVSKRVYKAAYSHEKAVTMILNGECGSFNPLLLECLVEAQEQIRDQIRAEGSAADDQMREAAQRQSLELTEARE